MTNNFFILPDFALSAQEIGSNPKNSVWASANAGSGKTHVLSQRVIRLLLGGVNPGRILCLTYTRLAATNMSDRIFSKLSKWAMLSDNELAIEIQEIEGKKPDISAVYEARRLFARALETPGGLKIQTIHAFCESILRRFSLEANVPAHFQLLGASMEEALINTAKRDMISGAASKADNPLLANAFAATLLRGGESMLNELLQEIISKRDDLCILIDRIMSLATDPEYPFAAFMEEFGFTASTTINEIAMPAWPVPGFSSEFFNDFVRHAHETSANLVLKGIIPAMAEAFQEKDCVRRLDLMSKALLKKDGNPYQEKSFKAPLHQRIPDLMDRYKEAVAAIQKTQDRLGLFRALERTVEIFIIADFLIGGYESLKKSKGFLDFNDLINRTVNLFAREDVGAWVRYRLDEGIDHILLDEAQDTSPGQWNVVKALGKEFFMGERLERTIFAVGDEKQSIYSFQGAVPDDFAKTGEAFLRLAKKNKQPFEKVNMTLSFRSSDDILQAVDCVFSNPERAKTLTRSQKEIRHHGIRSSVAGYVELWESIGKEKTEQPYEWYEPIDRVSAPEIKLAHKISDRILNWMNCKENPPGSNKTIAPRDILILLRKRDRFFQSLSSCLKEKNIPVAGVDRLRLHSHIAVQDLLALGRFLLQSDDDLSLAAVLKSPLFGVEENKLLELAAGRCGSLIDSMKKCAGKENSDIVKAVKILEKWKEEAALDSPFEFYSRVLGQYKGRKKMIGGLGWEAGEVLDEFLNFCLVQEQAGILGFQSFLSSLETESPEIRREMEYSRNEVRIMTVHAAKGLEAPVVFLVDSGSQPFSDQHLPSLLPFSTGGQLAGVKSYIWRNPDSEIKNNLTKKIIDDLKEEARREYHRLLYVGMTRARDRLIICGYRGKSTPYPESWAEIIRSSLDPLENTEKIKHPDGETILHFQAKKEVENLEIGKELETFSINDKEKSWPPLPDFNDLSEISEHMPEPLLPSQAGKEKIPEKVEKREKSAGLSKESSKNRECSRGSLIHRMLQILPDLEPSRREKTARGLMAQLIDYPDEEEKKEIWTSVCRVLESEYLSFLFSKTSLAEVPISGTLMKGGKKRIVSGRIDRLALKGDEVWIVDYKTSHRIANHEEEIPETFIVQAGLYAKLLEDLYQKKTIRTGILFTQNLLFLEIPETRRKQTLSNFLQA